MEEGGWLAVTDNGRGMPVDPHPKFPGKSALEIIMTKLHAGGKFDSGAYETSGGLHGVGVSVVNALSARTEVEVARGQTLYRQCFERGEPVSKLEIVGKAPNRRGTKVRFLPDPEIFGAGARFDPARVFKMTRAKAYLFGGVEIRWRCAPALLDAQGKTPPEAVFHFPGGLKDYLAADIEGQDMVVDQPFTGKVEKSGKHGSVEWAVAWLAAEDGFVHSYCNTIPTPDGGTHEAGLRIALLRAAEGPRRAHRPGQTRFRPDDRRRHVGLRRADLGLHPRAGIPGPEQGPAADRRSRAHRRDDCARRVRSLARRGAEPGPAAARLHGRARRRAAAPARGEGHRAQDRRAQTAAARQARRLLQHFGARLRTVHRRGRFRRRIGQTGARPRFAGDPAPARQNPQRRLGDARQARGEPAAFRSHAGPGRRVGIALSSPPICVTTRSSS